MNKTSLNDRNLKEYLIIISQWLSIALAFSIPVSTALDSILIASLLLTVLASNTNAVAQVIKSNPVARACALLFVLLMIGMSYGDAPLDIKVGILGKYSDLALMPLLLIVLRDELTRKRIVVVFLLTISATAILSWLVGLHILPASSCIWRGCVPENPILSGSWVADG